MIKVSRTKYPLTSNVTLDNMTNIAQECFDYTFDGISKFYPFDHSVFPQDFNIGLIIGNSGTGKTTLLSNFGTMAQSSWDNSKAIISHFPNKEEALEKLFACGLNTIPEWVKPFHILSNGQQYRANIALTINNKVIYDEFTSYLDRPTAFSLCVGIYKYIKKHNITVTFSTTHRDIIPFLKPDWIFDANIGNLYLDCLIPEVPFNLTDYLGEFNSILGAIKVYKIPKELKNDIWEIFKHTHYLSEKLNTAAHCYVACYKNEIVGFNSALAQVGKIPNCWREHRLVVRPEYQGLGIGSKLSNFVGELYLKDNKRYFSKSAHPKLGEYRMHSPLWRPTSSNQKNITNKGDSLGFNQMKIDTRTCYSFEYVGENPIEHVYEKKESFLVPLYKDGIIYLSKPLSKLTKKHKIVHVHIKRMINGTQKKVRGFSLVPDDVLTKAETLLANMSGNQVIEININELRSIDDTK